MNELNADGSPNQRFLATLLNPYKMKQSDMARIQIFIDPADKYLLKSVFPSPGIESYMLAGFYQSICKELRDKNITVYTPENARTVTQIITSHFTPVPTSGQGHQQNVSGGGSSVHAASANSAEQSSDVHEAAKRRRGDRGRVLRERIKVAKENAESKDRSEQASGGST